MERLATPLVDVRSISVQAQLNLISTISSGVRFLGPVHPHLRLVGDLAYVVCEPWTRALRAGVWVSPMELVRKATGRARRGLKYESLGGFSAQTGRLQELSFDRLRPAPNDTSAWRA